VIARRAIQALFLGTCLLFPLNSHAIVLDWNAVNWTSTWGSPAAASVSQAFTVEGVTVTITVARGGSTGTGEVSNPTGTPDDVNTPVSTGGQEGLMVDVDFNNMTTAFDYTPVGGDDYLTFTIAFSTTVAYVNFDLWDIDLGNDGTPSHYQDVVIFDSAGANPTLSLTAGNTDSEIFTDNDGNSATRGIATLGSTTNTGNEDDTSGTANVNVNYGSTGVTSVSFRYYSGNGTRNGTDVNLGTTDPTLQRISLGDITFVPEPSTWVSGGLLALLLIGHGLHRKRVRAAS